MNLKCLSLLALVALPGMAQDRWQIGLTLNQTEAMDQEYLIGNIGFLRAKHKAAFHPGLMVGYRVWDLGASDLSLTGEYQFRTGSKVETTAVGGMAGMPGMAQQYTDRYYSQSWAPGVQWNLHHAVDWGFGLQYRFTRIEQGGVKARNDRPWLSAHIGHTFKTDHAVKPFVALRSSIALSRTGKPDRDALAAGTRAAQQRGLRSLDGNHETSLQFGVRF